MRKPKIVTIAAKERRHILRDPRSLVLIFLLPVVMILLYGYAVNLDLRNIPLSVVDYDHTSSSRLVLERMVNSGYFSVTGHYGSVAQAEPDVIAGRSFGILVFPVNFACDLYRPAQPARIQLILDGSDANTATITSGYFSAFLRTFDPTGAGLSVRPRILYNPDLESVKFIVPGLAGVLLMMICALMTSVTITREKEFGTLELVLTTPIQPYQVILGKVLPYIVIAFLECLTIVGFSHVWFGVPVSGSLFLLMGLTFGYLFCALAIGITISAAVESQQVAMSLAMVATMLPSVMLSGFIFPVASMPLPLRLLSGAIPATYYLKIIRGIMLKGVGWNELWPNFAILIGFGVFFLLVGMKKFKTRLG
ncbi:MAG: ABC transporter permease [Candidatus Glassbacteria bacterium]